VIAGEGTALNAAPHSANANNFSFINILQTKPVAQDHTCLLSLTAAFSKNVPDRRPFSARRLPALPPFPAPAGVPVQNRFPMTAPPTQPPASKLTVLGPIETFACSATHS